MVVMNVYDPSKSDLDLMKEGLSSDWSGKQYSLFRLHMEQVKALHHRVNSLNPREAWKWFMHLGNVELELINYLSASEMELLQKHSFKGYINMDYKEFSPNMYKVIGQLNNYHRVIKFFLAKKGLEFKPNKDARLPILEGV